MSPAKIDEALNFLEGSPEHRGLMGRLEKLSSDNKDHDPEQSLAIIMMFRELIGVAAFKDAGLVCAELNRERDNMSADQMNRFTALLRPYVAFRNEVQNLQRLGIDI